MKMKIRPSTKAPALAWIGNTDPSSSTLTKSYYQAWNTADVAFDSPISIFSEALRELDIAFDGSSNWLAMGVQTNTDYQLRVLLTRQFKYLLPI